MRPFPPGLEPVEDLSPSVWVLEALKDWPVGRFHVRDLIPPVFEAYARILHRPHRAHDGREPTGTWKERAAELGLHLSPETNWRDLAGSGREAWSVGDGSLTQREVTTLASFLDGHTPTPGSCWFAVWTGWGILTGGTPLVLDRGRFHRWKMRRNAEVRARQERRAMAKLSTFPLLGMSGRSYLLFKGSVADAGRFRFGEGVLFQSPNLWWPEDRSWFVHTEIDETSTYVGGPRALVDNLVIEQVLESFEVQPDSPSALY